MMNFADQTAAAVYAIILLVDYLFGVAFGVFGSVIFGSVRENRRMSLLEQAPDRLSAGARVILGLFTRDDDGYLRGLPPGRRGTGGRFRGDDPGSHGKGLYR